MSITAAERKLIRSALGLDNPDARGVGYRNRYFAGPADVATADALVAKGMAIRLDGEADPLFKITTAGFRAASKPGEKMDREESSDMRRYDARAIVGS